MPDAALLMAALRLHVNAAQGCPPCVDRHLGCPDCWPEVGWYCPVGLPLAEAFVEARRAEVLAAAERWR
jgi:hypothetical protein